MYFTSLRKIGLALLPCISFSLAWSQQSQIPFDSVAYKYSQTISRKDLSTHLNILASDEYEGRETGEKGQKMAAEYIASWFKEWGLLPVGTDNSYFQKFEMVERKYAPIQITSNGVEFKEWNDFVMYNRDYENKQINAGLVLVPMTELRPVKSEEVKGKVALLISDQLGGDEVLRENIINHLYASGALMILEVYTYSPTMNITSGYKHYLNKGKLFFINEPIELEIPLISITRVMAAKLLQVSEKKFDKATKLLSQNNDKWNKKLNPAPIQLKIEVKDRLVKTENVCGLIEGKSKKDEIIVLSAHYDHIGVKHDTIVYNGADDDGSGTVAIMEMAQAFSLARKEGVGPERSILVIGMTGEEKGLLGSEYYSNHPIFPLENTVANLNTDMIGRLDETHATNPNYVYLIGSDMLSSELHQISEAVNKTYKNIALDYKYNDVHDANQFYYRSDHYNFAKHGIPVIFYFNGTHEDYHQPTDTVDKILFGKMENITQLIFYTAWELANRDKRIVVDKK